MCVQNVIELSAAVHESSTVH